jgi:hypothetical protein
LEYTFQLLLNEILGLKYELTNQADIFAEHKGPKFSYSKKRVKDELHFESVSLLFETDVKYQPINFIEWEDTTGYFPVYNDSDATIDFFATAFFMVTRYEEYLPHQKDKYDRYRASHSLNMKAGILEKPVVNYYAQKLKALLITRFSQLVFKHIPFRYNITFDIDIAYSYKGKGIKRNTGALLRSLLFSQFGEARERLATLFSKAKDPFDTYDYILDVCHRNNLSPLFFFLVGKESRFDKNISHRTSEYRELIKKIDAVASTGVHLSYRSHIGTNVMQHEVKRLEHLTGHPIEKNRFHYLRFQIPDTYERLLKAGIMEDYSMGYAPHVGFRAGICTPFKFFNLKQNKPTLLTIHPITFMDATFTHYYHADNEFAMDKILQLMKSVKLCGGDFTGLWHNNSFTEKAEWKGWREIFETVAFQASALMTNENEATQVSQP